MQVKAKHALAFHNLPFSLFVFTAPCAANSVLKRSEPEQPSAYLYLTLYQQLKKHRRPVSTYVITLM